MTDHPSELDFTQALEQQWPSLDALLMASYTDKIDTLPGFAAQLAAISIEECSPQQLARMQFAEALFQDYCQHCPLHQDCRPLLNAFQERLMAPLFANPPALPWQQSAVVTALSELIKGALGWQSELGKASARFFDQLLPLLNDDITALRDFFAREASRVAKLEQRLIATEQGALRAINAKQQTARVLNQQMAGKQLPADVSVFLQGAWRESMRLVLLNPNDDGQWQTIRRLTETLIWSFQPIEDGNAGHRSRVIDSISELSEQLREFAVGLHHSDSLNGELALIEAQHLQILKGEPLNYQPFQLIDNSDSMLKTSVSVSQQLLRQVDALKPGEWFVYHHPDQQQRIKLLLKMEQEQQLLFSNFFGIKAAQFNFDEFAYLLSSQQIQRLSDHNPLQTTGENLLRDLQQQRQQVAQQAEAHQLRLEQQRQQLVLAKQRAEQKAAQARAAELAAQREASRRQRQLHEQHSQAQREKAVLQQLDKLRAGAVLGFQEGQSHHHCRLAAILQHNDQLVFVNREGVKQYTLSRQQLLEQILAGSAKIIDPGSQFDSTLQQVVNNLRARNPGIKDKL